MRGVRRHVAIDGQPSGRFRTKDNDHLHLLRFSIRLRRAGHPDGTCERPPAKGGPIQRRYRNGYWRADPVIRTLERVPKRNEKRGIRPQRFCMDFMLVRGSDRWDLVSQDATIIQADGIQRTRVQVDARDDNKDQNLYLRPPFSRCFAAEKLKSDRRSLRSVRTKSRNGMDSCQLRVISLRKALNRGCGRCGRLLNSGWNWHPTMNG